MLNKIGMKLKLKSNQIQPALATYQQSQIVSVEMATNSTIIIDSFPSFYASFHPWHIFLYLKIVLFGEEVSVYRKCLI